MLLKILILVVIIILLIHFYWPREKYEHSFGHSKKNIKKIIQTEKNDPFILGEIYNFNLEEPIIAQEYYDAALQEAIYNSLAENPERVLDRVFPFEFIQPAARVDTGDKYYDRPIRNDPQNVHDTNVRVNFQVKHNALLDETGHERCDLSELKTHCSEKAISVINSIESNEAYIENLNNTDYGVLCAVVRRAKLFPDIYESLNLALENCINNDGEIVCATGRVSNILDSLTLIDPVYGKPVVSTEILRRDILQDTLNYLNSIPDERRENDVEAVGAEIEELIKKNYSSPLLDKLIEEAKAGI